MKKFLLVISSVALMVCTLMVTASASEYYYYDGDGSYTIHASYDTYYSAYVFNSLPDDVSFIYNGNQVTVYSRSEIPYTEYRYNHNTGSWEVWGHMFTSAGKTVSLVNIGWEVYQSDVNIYDSNGELFFPLPPTLPEVVEELTQMEGQTLTSEVVGTMSNLVPFGVGCLALLTGLVLLSRKFLIFLR